MLYQNSVAFTHINCIKFLTPAVSSYSPPTRLKVPADPPTVNPTVDVAPPPVSTKILVSPTLGFITLIVVF